MPRLTPCGWVQSVDGAEFNELNVHAAANPKAMWLRAGNAGFEAGDAVALAWMERPRGARLQSADTQLRCRKALLAPRAALEVESQGYGVCGRVIM